MAMDRGALMQRVVGAVVLVSLVVIFLPMLLQSSGDKADSPDSHIPPIPEQVSTLVFKRDERGTFQPTSPVNSSLEAKNAPPTPASGAAESAVSTKPVITTARPGDAWMVQLGSFTTEAGAMALREKLRAKHYPSYVERVEEGAVESWRVKVGPELSQATAQALKLQLEKETKLKAVLAKHGS